MWDRAAKRVVRNKGKNAAPKEPEQTTQNSNELNEKSTQVDEKSSGGVQIDLTKPPKSSPNLWYARDSLDKGFSDEKSG